MLNSVEEGMRKYQGPAHAEALASLGSRIRRQPRPLSAGAQIVNLADDRERQLRIMDQEAQRCRAVLTAPCSAVGISQERRNRCLSCAVSAPRNPRGFARGAPKTPATITSARSASAAAIAANAKSRSPITAAMTAASARAVIQASKSEPIPIPNPEPDPEPETPHPPTDRIPIPSRTTIHVAGDPIRTQPP